MKQQQMQNKLEQMCRYAESLAMQPDGNSLARVCVNPITMEPHQVLDEKLERIPQSLWKALAFAEDELNKTEGQGKPFVESNKMARAISLGEDAPANSSPYLGFGRIQQTLQKERSDRLASQPPKSGGSSPLLSPSPASGRGRSGPFFSPSSTGKRASPLTPSPAPMISPAGTPLIPTQTQPKPVAAISISSWLSNPAGSAPATPSTGGSGSQAGQRQLPARGWSQYDNRDSQWRIRPRPRSTPGGQPAQSEESQDLPFSGQDSGNLFSSQENSSSFDFYMEPPQVQIKKEAPLVDQPKIKEEEAVELLRDKGMDDTLDMLSEEQKYVLGLILKGKSVFFTGSAGTGKSFLLKAIREALHCLRKNNGLFITGTTGVAACNVGGTTLHSFSGIGLGKGKVQDIVQKAFHSRAKRRWQDCKILVIDEISMLDAHTFDIVNEAAKYCRNNSAEPFGGVQLVLCGDFFQLPPIGINQNNVRFCFRSKSWSESIDEAVVLNKVFRQRNSEFISLLNEFRIGRVTDKNQQIIQQKVMETASKPVRKKDIKPTRLFALNRDVDMINRTEMEQLKTKARLFQAMDWAKTETFQRLLNNLRAPETLVLKTNAQVILLKNLDVEAGLVNGSTGIITSFKTREGFEDWGKLPVVSFRNPEGEALGDPILIEPFKWSMQLGKTVVAEREQIPLQLAWALSIHKSQGMTIPNLEVNLGNNVFDYGQAYVALSRATDLTSLRVTEFCPHVVRAHPEIVEFYHNLKSKEGVKQPLKIKREGAGKENSPPLESGWMTKKRKGPSTLSEEQRLRMEANRQRALAKLHAKRSQDKPTF